MNIKILGAGCTKCVSLYRVTTQIVQELGLDATVEKIDDYAVILGYGVMSSPGLVIDERVVSVGRVPTPAELRKLLDAQASR
ncbi:thioredoxin family protein [Cryobacterium sp. TMT1-21]|uniref:Thioredoxin family protein n=1 Tax=Cryobacterium shii TaxID=1259235 RepID=A0AAQ2HEY2_9MICO|nr:MULTISPECIES: thioredoxin family protein [Cryobacterium]TFC43601.1 thioredoxin family protein [Cryobacterium shii]TFC85974.1 thioredoxin family protein [Cryobacterium sp. TmT2-59]TFD13714.1 thioredoxin family protein [Cryobacterium sp. TMT4-10]TFD15921.1 thioredoxin family protein [Cryobacterium sp. TMT1-21]TFD19769.1 thioredoxin family protein [Cryobacterium sp. TMT2-23]